MPIENYFETYYELITLQTGRFSKWMETIKYKQKPKNYIFENGPEFDRVILEKKTITKI